MVYLDTLGMLCTTVGDISPEQLQDRGQAMMQETAQNLEQMDLNPVTEEGQRVPCDQCSARAMVIVIFAYGELSFCMHHYNINSEALTKNYGIAKLLQA
jgi:hypothetical protein